jgi:hypothetical protein
MRPEWRASICQGLRGQSCNRQPGRRQVGFVQDIDILLEIPGVRGVPVVRPPAGEVDWRLGTVDLVVAVIGAIDSVEELQDVRDEIDKTYG